MYRHIWAEVNLDALQYNISQILKLVPAEKVMGVIKANAYGHGAGAVSNLLKENGVNSFAVSNVYEALDLRHHISDGEILILGHTDPDAVEEIAKNKITICLYDLDCAKRISAIAEKFSVTINCHIKLDTGMGRLGFNCNDLSQLSEQLKQVFSLPAINVSGAFTHFATADRDGDPKGEFLNQQYSRFDSACTLIKTLSGKYDLKFHCSNSAATLLDHKNIDSAYYRAGIILYGLTPSVGLELPFTPKAVMSLKATVAQVKTINAGDTISYGRTFTATKKMKVATITAGYADGYHRNLSGKGYMLIKGKKAPIVGRVCMDQTVIDVTDIDGVSPEDEVILFGEGLPVEELASLLGTINYELVCNVAHRVPRIYLKNNRVINDLRYTSL